MQTVFEPSKENHRIVINSLPRKGDWICPYCHNLNFAFRKKCNRCKTQTREQNSLIPIPMAFELQEHYYRALSKNRNSGVVPLEDITNTLSSYDYDYDYDYDYGYDHQIPCIDLSIKNPEQTDINQFQQHESCVKFVPAELLTFLSLENIEIFEKITHNPFFWEHENYTSLTLSKSTSQIDAEMNCLTDQSDQSKQEQEIDELMEQMVTKLVN